MLYDNGPISRQVGAAETDKGKAAHKKRRVAFDMEDGGEFSDGSSDVKFVASMFDLGAFDANPDKAGRLAEFGRLSERSHNFGLMKTQLLKSQEDVKHQQLTVEALNETLKESKANQKFMETQLAAMGSQVVSYQ